MAKITTTNQMKNMMMPGIAYPATVLALATGPSYPAPPDLFGNGRQSATAELAQVLERAGLPPDVIDEVLGQLPDPVDFRRDAAVLDRYGLSRTRVTDLLGGSP